MQRWIIQSIFAHSVHLTDEFFMQKRTHLHTIRLVYILSVHEPIRAFVYMCQFALRINQRCHIVRVSNLRDVSILITHFHTES